MLAVNVLCNKRINWALQICLKYEIFLLKKVPPNTEACLQGYDYKMFLEHQKKKNRMISSKREQIITSFWSLFQEKRKKP